MSDLIVRFTPTAEKLARDELSEHERGDLICKAASSSEGDEIVYPRDNPFPDVAFCVLSVSGGFVDLDVLEE